MSDLADHACLRHWQKESLQEWHPRQLYNVSSPVFVSLIKKRSDTLTPERPACPPADAAAIAASADTASDRTLVSPLDRREHWLLSINDGKREGRFGKAHGCRLPSRKTDRRDGFRIPLRCVTKTL